MRTFRPSAFIYFLCTALPCATALGADYARQSLTELQQVARQFLATAAATTASSDRIVQLGDPDPRLQLAACGQPLRAYWPAASRPSGNTVLGVRCDDAPGWQVFLSVSISDYREVWVATRLLNRGEAISHDNVQLQRMPVAQLSGTPFTRFEDLEGSQVRQYIAAGEALRADRLCLVCKGDSVFLSAEGGGYSVQVQVVAESSANRGETIQVRNPSSRRLLSARVSERGRVTVPVL